MILSTEPDLTKMLSEGLDTIIAGHMEQMQRDPENADWYREDIERVYDEIGRRLRDSVG